MEAAHVFLCDERRAFMSQLMQMKDLLCALHQCVTQMNHDEVEQIQPHYKEVKYGCQAFGLHNDFHLLSHLSGPRLYL